MTEDWDVSYTAGRLTFTPETGQVVIDAMAEHPGSPVVDLGDVRTFPEVALIVRELAEHGPFTTPLRSIDDRRSCSDCGADCESDFWMTNPANHEPSCLFRRARALYPQDAGS